MSFPIVQTKVTRYKNAIKIRILRLNSHLAFCFINLTKCNIIQISFPSQKTPRKIRSALVSTLIRLHMNLPGRLFVHPSIPQQE